jgi:hypothetical protein
MNPKEIHDDRLWRRRESNTAHAISVERGSSLLSADSGEESPGCDEEGGPGTSVENDRPRRWCSNVARGIAEALAAIEAGRVDFARERMATLLQQALSRAGA